MRMTKPVLERSLTESTGSQLGYLLDGENCNAFNQRLSLVLTTPITENSRSCRYSLHMDIRRYKDDCVTS